MKHLVALNVVWQALLRLRAPALPRAWLALAALCSSAATVHAAGTEFTDDRGQRISLPAPPQRIVSLLPSLTETVCALQACNRLVGVDRYSNWPASVVALPHLGGLEDTQIERIVTLKPDLVLLSLSSRVADRLEALGLRVAMLEPKSLRDTQRVIRAIATGLGDAAAGDALWQRIDARMAAAATRVPAAVRGQKVYVEVSSAPYAAGESSFVGETLARLGMANAVPAALGPFPKLNPEYVVRAQPDVLMATTGAIADMPSRPGWDTLRALRQRRVCGFGAEAWDTLVRPGPRLADAADALADCLAGLPPINPPVIPPMNPPVNPPLLPPSSPPVRPAAAGGR